MFNIFVGVFALLSVCSPSVLAVPADFPIENLPADVYDSDLNLPIDPAKSPGISWRPSYETADSPKLPRLMLSVVIGAYQYWKNPSLSGIGQRMQQRIGPFPEFLHTVEPTTLGLTDLTPQRVGFVYCKIVRGILQQQTPPGKTTALVFETSSRRLLGTVTIANSPTHNVQEAPLLSPYLKSLENSSVHIISTPYNKTNGQLSMPSNTLTQEKAGLECLRKGLMEVFTHDWRPSVPGTSRLIRPGEVATFGNRYDDGIQANGTVTAGPTADSMIWHHLALATQTLYLTAALFDDFQTTRTASLGPPGGQPIGSVSIGRKYSPANVADGAATA